MAVPAKQDSAQLLPTFTLKSGVKVFYVGCNSDLSKWPAWARCLIRFCFFVTGYCNAPESISVCSEREIARAMCKGKHGSWFIHTLYLNEALPDDLCQLEPTEFPNSPIKERYHKYWPTLQAVRRKDLQAQLSGMEDHLNELSEILVAPEVE